MPTAAPCSAQDIIDAAPLGALIRLSDGRPRPPERFRRKLKDWENRNWVGRLTEKYRGRDGREGHFILHLGDFGSGAVIILSVRRMFGADSRAAFTIERPPEPGEALVLTDFQGRDELRHLAQDEAAARTWLEAHRYANARIETVPGIPAAASA